MVTSSSGPGAEGRRSVRSRPGDPRFEDDGRRIFTEDDLAGYFEAVDPRDLERERRRRHRRHGLVLGLVACLVLGVTLTAVQVLRGNWSIAGWEAAPPQEPLRCPAGTVEYAQDSPVSVYNGTTIGGLAGDVANALERRGFAIAGVGNRRLPTSTMVAVILAGPGGRQTAFAVQRNIEGSVFRPDDRQDASVDVIMGTKYTGLVPAEDVDIRPGPLDCQRLETEKPVSSPGEAGAAPAQRPPEKTSGTRVYMTAMTRASENRLSQTPARTICLMETSPEPKATALEGVATGSM